MAFNKIPTHARVAIYIRVSTLHQIDRDSLPMQRQDLIAYAKLILNTDDVTIFEDAGYSGKNTARPKFQEMMSQLRTGAYTHLLVWKIDRISRNLLDFAEMYQELKDLGVTFVSKNEQFDTSTAMGEAMLKIILVFAELERNMTSERVTATMISRASNGQWNNGGRIPYGYDYDPNEQVFSLNKLYLYSEKAMPESEYLTQKMLLSDSLEEVEDKLDFLASESSLQQSITDDEFIAKASNFILSQKLTGRSYVSFKSLSAAVSPEVLDSFLGSIIDNIVFKDGAVHSITFRNGLSHTFIYKEKPEV